MFTLCTILSVLNGQSTVFYLIYFFWWNELLHIIIDRICYRQNPNAILDENSQGGLFSSLLQMGIYWVFIVVFFGFIANWKNIAITGTNMQIFFFLNWFFNANLVFVIVERVLLHRNKQSVQVYFGPFTPNMIILHISIVVGAILMFFVVKKFPDIFTPDNLWGSVLIALPFIILKWLFGKKRN